MEGRSARLRLRVVPGARTNAVVRRQGETLKVRVAAPPERGAANDAVRALLAETLSVRKDSVSLVAGHGGRDKIVEFRGITRAEIESRLAAAERAERKDLR